MTKHRVEKHPTKSLWGGTFLPFSTRTALLIAHVAVGFSASRDPPSVPHKAGVKSNSLGDTRSGTAKDVAVALVSNPAPNNAARRRHLRISPSIQGAGEERGRQGLAEDCFISEDCAPGVFTVSSLPLSAPRIHVLSFRVWVCW